MTLFGGGRGRSFVDIVGDLEKKRPVGIIIRMDPKSNDKCPYKRHTDRRGEGHVKTETGIGVMQPPARGHPEPPEAEDARDGTSPGAPGGRGALLTP